MCPVASCVFCFVFLLMLHSCHIIFSTLHSMFITRLKNSFTHRRSTLMTTLQALSLCSPLTSSSVLFLPHLLPIFFFWACFNQTFLIGPAGLRTMSNKALAGTVSDALHAFPTPAGSVVTVALSGPALLTIPCNNREGLRLSLTKC